MTKRYKLRDLDIDRVDLVDRGANQYAEIVIVKSDDTKRAEIAKGLKAMADTQLKNGTPHVASFAGFKAKPKPKDADGDTKEPDGDPDDKKKKGAKGSAFPERMAAESSTGAVAPAPAPPPPFAKHGSHNQDDHGNWASGQTKDHVSTGNEMETKPGGAADRKKVADMWSKMRAADEDNIIEMEAERYRNKSTLYPGSAPTNVRHSPMNSVLRNNKGVGSTLEPKAKKRRRPNIDLRSSRLLDASMKGETLDVADIDRPRGSKKGSTRAQKLADEFSAKGKSKGFAGVGVPSNKSDTTYGHLESNQPPTNNIKKHGSHDQSSHGNWARGSKGPGPKMKRLKGGLFGNDFESMMRDAHEKWKSGGGIMHPAGGSGSKIETPMSPPKEESSGSTRSLSDIAREINADWSKQGKGVNYAAKPYLSAMRSLDRVSDNYGYDSGESVILYFLSNARSWKGETAKKVKAELKQMLKDNKGIRKAFGAPPVAGPPQKPQAPMMQQPQMGGVPPQAPPPQAAPAKPAPQQAPPQAAGGEGLGLNPNGPGPALGPGSAPGVRPTETPKVAPKKKPVSKPGAPAPVEEDKKKTLADLVGGKGQSPSVPSQVPPKTNSL